MKIHTPYFLYNTSIDYFNIAQNRCNEIFAPGYSSDGSLFLKISAPAAMLSFSVELMIKSLLLKRIERYSKDHNLIKLYSEIPSEDVASIEFNYQAVPTEHFNYPVLRFVVEGHNLTESKISFETPAKEIRYRLEEHENSFVNWRYVASFSVDTSDKIRHFDFDFMCRFFVALSKHVKGIVKN